MLYSLMLFYALYRGRNLHCWHLPQVNQIQTLIYYLAIALGLNDLFYHAMFLKNLYILIAMGQLFPVVYNVIVETLNPSFEENSEENNQSKG